MIEILHSCGGSPTTFTHDLHWMNVGRIDFLDMSNRDINNVLRCRVCGGCVRKSWVEVICILDEIGENNGVGEAKGIIGRSLGLLVGMLDVVGVV